MQVRWILQEFGTYRISEHSKPQASLRICRWLHTQSMNVGRCSNEHLDLKLRLIRPHRHSLKPFLHLRQVKQNLSKTAISIRPKIGCQDNNRLMHVKSIVECSRGKGAFYNTFDLH